MTEGTTEEIDVLVLKRYKLNCLFSQGGKLLIKGIRSYEITSMDNCIFK
jgi:hypothetical protein